MKTLWRPSSCAGSTDRARYQRYVALMALTKSMMDLLTMAASSTTDIPLVALGWLNPFVLISPWLNGDLPFMIALSTLLFFVALAWHSAQRLRDMGWSMYWGMLTLLPFVNLGMTLLLALAPSRRRSVWDLV